MQEPNWTTAFRASVSDLPSTLPGASHERASERLRTLVKSGILKLTAVRDSPRKKKYNEHGHTGTYDYVRSRISAVICCIC